MTMDWILEAMKTSIRFHHKGNCIAAWNDIAEKFEKAVEEIAELPPTTIIKNKDGKVVQIKNPAWGPMIKEMLKGKNHNSKPLQPIKNPLVKRMEENCQVIKSWINKTDLNHKQRIYLMFSYARAGQPGFDRLKEIMSRQINYKAHITETHIRNYQKQGNFFGVSCRKLITEGFCNFKECDKYAVSAAKRLDEGGGSR